MTTENVTLFHGGNQVVYFWSELLLEWLVCMVGIKWSTLQDRL